MIFKKTSLFFTMTLGAAFNYAAQAKQITLDYEFQNPSGNGQFFGLVSSESSASQYEFTTPAVQFGGIRGNLTIDKTHLWFDVNPYPLTSNIYNPYPGMVTSFTIGMDMSFSGYSSIPSGQFYNGEVLPPTYFQAPVQLNFKFIGEEKPGYWTWFKRDENGVVVVDQFGHPLHEERPYDLQYYMGGSVLENEPDLNYQYIGTWPGVATGVLSVPYPWQSWVSQALSDGNSLSTKSDGLFINLSAYKPSTPQVLPYDLLPEVAIVPFTVPEPSLYNLPYPTDGPGAVSGQLVGTLRNYQIYSDPKATGNSFSNPADKTVLIEQGDNAFNNLEFTNEGVIDNEDVLTNWHAAKLINRNLIQNNGQLINYGLLENNNSAALFNDGVVYNLENAQFKQHGGSFQNSAVAILENAGNALFDQNAILRNEGFIAQKGGQKFVLESGARLENGISGVLDNFGHMVIGNLAVIHNEGRYVGNGNSDLLIDHGEFDNFGLINLAGTPVLGVISPSIMVTNNGSLSNASGKQITGSTGSIWLKDGGYFLNRGDVDVGSLSLSSTSTTRTTHFQNYFDGRFTGKVLLSGQGTEFENRGNTSLINESQMTNKSLLFLAANSLLKVNENASLLLASGAEIKGTDRTSSRLENLGLLDIKSFINITGINLHNAATVRTSGVVELDKGVFENDSALVMDGNSLFIIGADQIMRVGSPDGAAGLVQGLDPVSKITNNGTFELHKGAYVSQGEFQQMGNFLLDIDLVFDGKFSQYKGFSDIQGKMLKTVSVEGGNLVSTGAEFGDNLDVISTTGIPASAIFWNSTASSIANDMTVGKGGKVHVQSGATVAVGGEVWDSGKVLLDGNLQVGAANGGFFYLNQGGQLGGPGKITLLNQGKVIMNGGSIVPGDPVTFTIDGDLEVNQGTLDIQIAGSGDHDVIKVTGNTVFNGGTVKFNYMNDYFVAPSASPDVAWLSAGGHVTGVENLHQLFAYTQSSGQLYVIDPQYDYLIGVTGGVVNELPHYSNTAAIETRAGGVLSNQAGGMLVNEATGVITNQDGGTLNNIGSDSVLFNAGSLRNMGVGATLNNTGSMTNSGLITNQVGATFNNGDTVSNDVFSVLENRGEIQNSGQFSNAGGADLINRGLFKNNGTVSIADNSFIEGEGLYIQESGETRVDGLLVQTSTEILGGKIGGNGALNGNLMVDGAGIDLWESDTLTVNGELVVTNGWVNFSMGGTEEHGLLNVNGQGTFSGGIVKIDFTNGYSPVADDFFTYLYAANGLYGIDTLQFQFTGLPNGMRLDFIQDTNSLGWRAVGIAAVPLPPSAWLMASALAGLASLGRTRKFN
jgi:hypothetical protein